MNTPKLIYLILSLGVSQSVFAQRFFTQNVQPVDSSLVRYLAPIDSLFASLPAWLWTLYEPASGGFYATIGMRHQPGRFGPDIQFTQQALGILADCGYPPGTLPDSVRQRAIHFFQSRQNAKTGFFVDPHYPQAAKSERVLGRLVAFSTAQLSALGAAPRHPLPGQQATLSTTLWYYSSADSLDRWLDQLPWKKSVWTAMDAISAQKWLLKTLPEAKRTAFTRQMYNYALARQDADGMWGTGHTPGIRLSGTVKFAWFCREVGLPLPNPQPLYNTLVGWYRARPSKQDAFKRGTTVPGNAISLYGELMSYLPQPFPRQDIALVLEESTAMQSLQNPGRRLLPHLGHLRCPPRRHCPTTGLFQGADGRRKRNQSVEPAAAVGARAGGPPRAGQLNDARRTRVISLAVYSFIPLLMLLTYENMPSSM